MDPFVDPPFEKTYEALLGSATSSAAIDDDQEGVLDVANSDQLPLIDLGRLQHGAGRAREECKREIVEASKVWGFFQVTNHGISTELMDRISLEQIKVFRQPFEEKDQKLSCNFLAGINTYHWGTPTATSLQQLSWSEAFHIPLLAAADHDHDKSSTTADHEDENSTNNTLRSTIEEFAEAVSILGRRLAKILSEEVGDHQYKYCCPRKTTCYLRLSRYPPCPFSSKVFGIVPHTDSDFLTILYQDQVGGLQLLRDDGRWITVNPIQDAFVVNIGDLFQAWSNGAYKSVKHRVMANSQVERFSVAYFMFPSQDTVIESVQQPPMYRKFSFREYMQQVRDDVNTMGCKIGLSRFLINESCKHES